MIGIDTNIMVRYLTKDDPLQTPKAAEILEKRISTDAPRFISVVAIAETVWVLERSYGFSLQEIASAIESILQVPDLVVESQREVFIAMTALRDGYGDFGDVLIAGLGAKAGCVANAHVRSKGIAPSGL
jgi:predicted nucleic-acid-binding protein